MANRISNIDLVFNRLTNFENKAQFQGLLLDYPISEIYGTVNYDFSATGFSGSSSFVAPYTGANIYFLNVEGNAALRTITNLTVTVTGTGRVQYSGNVNFPIEVPNGETYTAILIPSNRESYIGVNIPTNDLYGIAYADGTTTEIYLYPATRTVVRENCTLHFTPLGEGPGHIINVIGFNGGYIGFSTQQGVELETPLPDGYYTFWKVADRDIYQVMRASCARRQM